MEFENHQFVLWIHASILVFPNNMHKNQYQISAIQILNKTLCSKNGEESSNLICKFLTWLPNVP